MIKQVPMLLMLLLFAGCAAHTNFNQSPHEKAFAEEDEYILYALYAEEQKEYDAASKLFGVLYDRSGKKEYLYHSLSTQMQAGDFDALLTRTNTLLKEIPDDLEIMRFEVLALIKKKEYDAAKEKALLIVDRSGAPQDYLLVSEIYIKQGRYDMAVKYLESAYTINYDERILDKMTIILYVNLGRRQEAISYLETHSRLNGCSKLICRRLAGFYSENNNVDGMLSTYLRLYDIDPDDEYAHAIVKIYNYKKEYLKLMLFLEKSGADDPMLLQLYINNRTYDKAAVLAKKLYDEQGDVAYLGQYAIFTYESSKDKKDPKMLENVVQTLETVLQQSRESLYLNYLGYLLIDHDIDVRRGMSYIKEALKEEPDSPFYLDSLAWGYYKLGNCSGALKLMKKVEKELGTKDEEVKSHIDAIKKCLQRKK